MPIQAEQDDRLRAVGSVLLLTDLIHMNDYWKYPAVKTLTLKHVEPCRDHPCAVAAREMDPPKSMGAAFQCFAVYLGSEGARFALYAGLSDFGQEFLDRDFANLLSDFCLSTGLRELWTRTSELWDETVSDCRVMLAEEDPGPFLDLFYGNIAADLIVVPSPLSPTSFSYGPCAGNVAYAIIGPPNVPKDSSAEVRYLSLGRSFQGAVFHELSHSLLNMAEGRVPEVALGVYEAFGSMPTNEKFRDIHGSDPSRLWFDELLIRAATALYDNEMGRTDRADAFLARQQEEYGLGWIRPVYVALDRYLAERKEGRYAGLHEYLGTLANTATQEKSASGTTSIPH